MATTSPRGGVTAAGRGEDGWMTRREARAACGSKGSAEEVKWRGGGAVVVGAEPPAAAAAGSGGGRRRGEVLPPATGEGAGVASGGGGRANMVGVVPAAA